MKDLNKIWNNRKAILEGVGNIIFKTEHVEEIAAERMDVCKECPDLDLEGSSCIVSGTQPCCSQCGCSLKLKLRSLSSACGNDEEPRWPALVSPEIEDVIKEDINYKEPD